MQQALRPYAAAGVALVGASIITVTGFAAAPSLMQTTAPAVELASVDAAAADADAFALLANALDPTASTDGLLGAANSLDSFLDLFGNPTVNVADTLAADLVGYLNLPASLGGLDGAIGTELSTIDTDLNNGFSSLIGDLNNDVNGLHSDLINTLNNLLSGTIAADLNNDFTNLDNILTSELGNISGELGSLNTISFDLGTVIPNSLANIANILTEILAKP